MKSGSASIDIGRGTQRGTALILNSVLKGWLLGTG